MESEFLNSETPEEYRFEDIHKQFEKLKRSQLYNSEKQEWRLPLIDTAMIDYDKKLNPLIPFSELLFKGGTDRKRTYSETQLMGIIVEGLFNKEAGQERLRRLRTSEEYDCPPDDPYRCSVTDMIMELIADYKIGNIDTIGSFKEKFENFDERRRNGLYLSSFRDAHDGLWSEARHEQFDQSDYAEAEERYPIFEIPIALLDSQFIGILAQSIFDKNGAKEFFEDLKEHYYDGKNKKWIHEISSSMAALYSEGEGRGKDPNWYAGDELLAILVEAQFDMQKAQEHYKILKKNPNLYRNGVWIHPFPPTEELPPKESVERMIQKGKELLGAPSPSPISEEGVQGPESAYLQLLDIWIQKTFEEAKA